MSFKIEIETRNAAFYDEWNADSFDPNREIVRILKDVAGIVADSDGTTSGTILDINGNTVGSWELTTDD